MDIYIGYLPRHTLQNIFTLKLKYIYHNLWISHLANFSFLYFLGTKIEEVYKKKSNYIFGKYQKCNQHMRDTCKKRSFKLPFTCRGKKYICNIFFSFIVNLFCNVCVSWKLYEMVAIM